MKDKTVQDPKIPLQTQPILQSRQGRMFYLRTTSKGDYGWYKYLTAFQKADWSQGKSKVVRDRIVVLTGPIHVDDIQKLKKTSGTIPAKGATAGLHEGVDECSKYGIDLECKTPEGHGVTKVRFLTVAEIPDLTHIDYVRSTIHLKEPFDRALPVPSR